MRGGRRVVTTAEDVLSGSSRRIRLLLRNRAAIAAPCSWNDKQMRPGVAQVL